MHEQKKIPSADELQSNLVTKILLKSQQNSSLLYNS